MADQIAYNSSQHEGDEFSLMDFSTNKIFLEGLIWEMCEWDQKTESLGDIASSSSHFYFYSFGKNKNRNEVMAMKQNYYVIIS